MGYMVRFKPDRKQISLWLISIILCIVSFEGILSFPRLIGPSLTLSKSLVCLAQVTYVIFGVFIVVGLWKSLNITPKIIIGWGIASMGAALGGPFAYSTVHSLSLPTAVFIILGISLITFGLFLFSLKLLGGDNYNNDIVRRLIQVVSLLLFTTLALFISAGTVYYAWGWVYVILYLVYIVINASLLPEELIAERGKSKDNVKRWDKVINIINIIPGVGLIVLSGLDFRYKWTPEVSIYLHITGLILYLSGSIMFSWSMVSNKFFSTSVRIQIDRDHKVENRGPYKFVRHPGYAGFIISTLGVPFVLGSLWALIPAIITGILFIIRTKLEDKTLLNELPGYKDFSEETKFKLIPGIW